jgi:hypothetical protein
MINVRSKVWRTFWGSAFSDCFCFADFYELELGLNTVIFRYELFQISITFWQNQDMCTFASSANIWTPNTNVLEMISHENKLFFNWIKDVRMVSIVKFKTRNKIGWDDSNAHNPVVQLI